MRSTPAFRRIIPILSIALVTVWGCDSASDDPDRTFTVTLEGNGTGRMETQSITLGLEIDCRIADGTVTGTCEDTFFPPDSDGFIRVRATPAAAMDFSWGAPCQQAVGALCDVPFDADGPPELNVRATFDVKTERVVMTPPNSTITTPGEEGAVLISARAVDEDGDEVPGVSYAFEVDRSDVVTMTAESANSVRIVPTASGQAIVTATAQGVSGTAAIDVRLSN